MTGTNYLISGSYDKSVGVWDYTTGLLVRNLTGHTLVELKKKISKKLYNFVKI